MKATGLIRKIDDLGRIVIPKEIRTNLKIRNGENLEIFIDNLDQIILKKYSKEDDYKALLESYVQTIYDAIKRNVLITDKNVVLAANNKIKKNYIDLEIGQLLRTCIENRSIEKSEEKSKINIINTKKMINCSYVIAPIIASSECVGVLMIFDEKEKMNTTDELVADIASKFLGKYLEN